ncbi:MAG: GYF domain-containing protein [Chitinophagaceae bacterium]|nr:GYF domain-containing protein [Chitinophagaceae bacterium]
MSNMKYFYALDNEQKGPFTLQELKLEPIKKSTLVWREDFPEWKRADEVDETKDFAVAEPPPLPVTQFESESLTDTPTIAPFSSVKISGYKKQSEATIVGVFMFFLPIAVYVITYTAFHESSNYNSDLSAIMLFFSILSRVGGSLWVYYISMNQNRNHVSWAILGFFLPSVSLIIIGLLDRLPVEINIDYSLPENERIKRLIDRSIELKEQGRLDNEFLHIQAALNIDPKSELALLKKAEYIYGNNLNRDIPLKIFRSLCNSHEFGPVANYFVGKMLIETGIIEEARMHLKTAKEQGNEMAAELYTRHFELRGKYKLSREELKTKLSGNITKIFPGSYIDGLKELDSDDTISGMLDIHINNQGISLESKKLEVFVGIQYSEMFDIVREPEGDYITLYLFDNTQVRLGYGKEFDTNSDCLKTLTRNFKAANRKDCSVKM